MIKVVCINNEFVEYDLELNKIYDGEFITIDEFEYCEIHFNSMNDGLYTKERFIPLAEWREQQLKKILDD